MKYLQIKNQGVMEIEALTLVGASTKREDDSKIGQFGSGNKYALAYLLRNNYDVKVFSGDQEIVLTTVERSLKDNVFNIICVNGKETSITTEMGHHWVLWQAIREIYSNAIDEGLISFEIVDTQDQDLSRDSNSTTYYIGLNDDLYSLYYNIGDYFAIDKVVLFECKYGKVYKKTSNKCNIYRRGIKCYETNKDSIFDYDLNDIDIDENRLIKYSWSLPSHIFKILTICDNEYVVRSILNEIQDKSKLENLIDDQFSDLDASEFSDTWSECLKDSSIVPRSLGGYVKDSDVASTKFLPNRLYNGLISKFGETNKPKSFRATNNGVFYVEANIDNQIEDSINSVLDFFAECKFEVDYKIKVVKFINSNIHGSIEDNDTILIGINAFSKGKAWIANVIIEELIHLKYDAKDETRAFQDASIELFLMYMQKINAYNL